MPEFDVQAARQSGATDDQILAYLAQRSPNFDVQGALGTTSKADVINYLATRSAGPMQPQQQQPTATIGPRPSGANSWLNDLESDVRYGGQSTFVGRALRGLGAQGTDVGAQAGTQENMLASPVLGPLRAARGAAEVPNAPWQATKDIAGGALQTAALPSAFIAPEAGHAADTAAQGITRAGSALGSRLVPSMIKEKAGQLFNVVAQDAGNVPVALENSQEAALRLMDMQKVTNLGPTVNKFINRITKPGADPLTYNEARDFYSALGEMSWGDRLTLNPKVQYFARQLVSGLKQDIGNAAEQVGQAANYYQAMGQYARAQRLKAAYLALPGVAFVEKKYHTLRDLMGSVTDIAGTVAP